jgi:hypothetical protein
MVILGMHSRVKKTFVPRLEIQTCALCTYERRLKDSHVIPRFIRHLFLKPYKYYDWANPGEEEQDLAKFPLLCGDCEQRLSANERVIARKVHAALGKPVQGLPTLDDETYFVFSVLWRAYQAITRFKLSDTLVPEPLNGISSPYKIVNALPKQTDQALQTAEAWRKFLLAPVGTQECPEYRSWQLVDTYAQTVGGGTGRYSTGWNLLTGPSYQSVVVLMHSSVFIGSLLPTTDIESEAEGVRLWLNFLGDKNSVFKNR